MGERCEGEGMRRLKSRKRRKNNNELAGVFR
jgi:hypothetical protein